MLGYALGRMPCRCDALARVIPWVHARVAGALPAGLRAAARGLPRRRLRLLRPCALPAAVRGPTLPACLPLGLTRWRPLSAWPLLLRRVPGRRPCRALLLLLRAGKALQLRARRPPRGWLLRRNCSLLPQRGRALRRPLTALLLLHGTSTITLLLRQLLWRPGGTRVLLRPVRQLLCSVPLLLRERAWLPAGLRRCLRVRQAPSAVLWQRGRLVCRILWQRRRCVVRGQRRCVPGLCGFGLKAKDISSC